MENQSLQSQKNMVCASSFSDCCMNSKIEIKMYRLVDLGSDEVGSVLNVRKFFHALFCSFFSFMIP